ncbi:MAG: hypothetical protein KPEEDBHJ_03446 [Anaerolineales bacterium]|nr:hypothetical protein [Anaerolineales bacterium]
MWQNNISWVEGLFSEIPFKRFQEIRTKSQWDSPLAIFTRLNPNRGNDWPNLRFEGIQSSTSPAIRAFDTLFSPDYYIVAVDTRVRTTILSVNIKTQDHITGKVSTTIEYQAVSIETLLNVGDPLASMKDRAGEMIKDFIARRDYEDISETEVKNELRRLHEQVETGLVIKGVSGIHIEWPESITQRLQKSVIDKIDDKTQRKLNDLKVEKLNSFGIHDPILIASVLSQSDGDFEVIMGHVRSASQAYKDQMDRDLSLLNWLKERDLLARADVQNVIDSLTGRINDQASQSSPLLKGLLGTANDDRRQLKDGDATKEKHSEKDKDNQDGPPVIGKRKINLPNKSDE